MAVKGGSTRKEPIKRGSAHRFLVLQKGQMADTIGGTPRYSRVRSPGKRSTLLIPQTVTRLDVKRPNDHRKRDLYLVVSRKQENTRPLFCGTPFSWELLWLRFMIRVHYGQRIAVTAVGCALTCGRAAPDRGAHRAACQPELPLLLNRFFEEGCTIRRTMWARMAKPSRLDQC